MEIVISKNKRKTGILLLLLALLVLAVPSHASAKVRLSKTSITLTKGSRKKLTVKGTSKKVTWSSSKRSVATVNAKGVVTAKNKGKAVITARVGKKKYKCKVTVKLPAVQKETEKETEAAPVVSTDPTAKLELSQSSVTLTTRNSIVLSASNAKSAVVWTSSDPDVITVSADGTVYAAKVGSAVVTASSAGESASCQVNSEAPKASTAAYTFLGIVNRYSLELQEYRTKGCLVGYSNASKLNPTTWAKAKLQLEKKGTTYTNCALLVRWALVEMGYLEEGQMLYGINASSHNSHSWCENGIHFGSQAVRNKILEHCEIIEVHDTPDHLAVTGQLLPGDICTWDGMTHTNVFVGNGTFFDAGRGPSDGSYWKKSEILKFGISEATVTADIKNGGSNPSLAKKTYIFNSFGPEEQWDRYYCGKIGYIIRIVK